MYLRIHQTQYLRVDQVVHFPTEGHRPEFWSVILVAVAKEETLRLELFFDTEPVGFVEGQFIGQVNLNPSRPKVHLSPESQGIQAGLPVIVVNPPETQPNSDTFPKGD